MSSLDYFSKLTLAWVLKLGFYFSGQSRDGSLFSLSVDLVIKAHAITAEAALLQLAGMVRTIPTKLPVEWVCCLVEIFKIDGQK